MRLCCFTPADARCDGRVISGCLAVVAYILPAIAADDPSVALPGVTDLTPENFDAYVGGQKNALVEFYAPVRGRARNPGRPSAPSRD